MQSVSVIIPAYGPTAHLAAILDALYDGTLRADEIVVSHSGAGDPGAELGARFPKVAFLHSDFRLLAGTARNRGATMASGTILAFCDSDVLPAPDWLERITAALAEDERRFVVGSVGMAQSGGYWGTVNWLCEFSEQGPWRARRMQTGGASCNMAIRRIHFDQIGGFSERHRVGEDTLLFHALREHGFQQWFEPAANVGHFNHAGLQNLAQHQWMHGKHFPQVRGAANLPGSRIAHRRWLVPLLPLAKLSRIVGRLLEGGAREQAWVLLYFPGLLIGMTIWGSGLIRGLLVRAARTPD